MILLDGHETSVFAGSTTVRLRRHSIVLSNGNKVILNLLNELMESLSLLLWDVRMEVGESIEGNWNHANSRVKLHGARPKRNHGVG